MVSFTDNSSGDVSSWQWTFEGGDPATSTDQNPVVTYNTNGTFDVELEVSDGTNTNSLLLEDYITVDEAPPVMLMPFDMVCLTWPAFELTGGSPSGGVYGGPGVTDGWFYPDVAGIGTHTISYTFTGLSGCSNTAEETIIVDPCTGIFEASAELLGIYPNPSNGSFSVKAPVGGTYDMLVYDLTGNTVYSERVQLDSAAAINVELSEIRDGLYFVSLVSAKNNFVGKINILND